MESKADAKEKAKKEAFEGERDDEEDGGGDTAIEDEKKKRATATVGSPSLKKGGTHHL